MEQVTLLHVVAHDPVEHRAFVVCEVGNQLAQLSVLRLQVRERKPGAAFQLAQLFEVLRRLRVVLLLLLVCHVSLVEVAQGFVPDLLAVVANAEPSRPLVNRAHSLLHRLDVVRVQLVDLAVHAHDAARLVEVVVVLSEN